MEIFYQPWWVFALSGVSILFTGLTCIYLYSTRIERYVKSIYTYVVDMPMADGTVAMTTMMGEEISTDSYTQRYQLIDFFMSKIFVAIPISCAAIYLVSNIPGFTAPSWFNIVLQFMTYGSAAIFYMFVKKEDE